MARKSKAKRSDEGRMYVHSPGSMKQAAKRTEKRRRKAAATQEAARRSGGPSASSRRLNESGRYHKTLHYEHEARQGRSKHIRTLKKKLGLKRDTPEPIVHDRAKETGVTKHQRQRANTGGLKGKRYTAKSGVQPGRVYRSRRHTDAHGTSRPSKNK